MGFDSNLSAHVLHVCNSDEGKSVENIVQAYLSAILAHKGILSDNGTYFEVLNKVCNQLSIKRLFSNPFHPQGNAKVENVHNFLKEPSPNSRTAVM